MIKSMFSFSLWRISFEPTITNSFVISRSFKKGNISQYPLFLLHNYHYKHGKEYNKFITKRLISMLFVPRN